MSVQLIVYPQSYNGQSNTLSSSPTELVVNGISFANLDNTGTYTSTAANPYSDTVTNAPPSIVNTWNRFKKGTIAFPTVVAADLVLVGNSSEISGVYQELSNLTIGAQYTININIPVAVAGGFVGVRVFLGTSLQASNTYSSNVTQISKTFNAAFTELTIMISYFNAASSNLTISNISTQPVIGAVPSGSTSILDDGQVICDLYEDEDLPLTLSVDNFKNVAEKVQSYSKAFNLPATKRNNKIFDQIFEITRSYDGVIFNPYKKTECVLKQDGFVLFQGFLRMLDVTEKNGEISYNVNLYSEVIALADFLKDRSFRDLDFTELTHDYNYSEIRNSWVNNNIFTNPSTSGFRSSDTVKYPFVDWNHQFILGASGNPVLPNLESAFRPFISIKYLIDRIFEGSPFTYTSSFFDLDTTAGGAFDFDKLYMDFNWGADNSPVTLNNIVNGFYEITTATNFAPNGSFGNLALTSNFSQVDYNNTTNKFTATTNNVQYNISYDYQIRVAITNAEYSARWLVTRAATGFEEVYDLSPMQPTGGAGAVYNFSGIITPILQIGDTLEAQFSSNTTSGIVQNFSGTGAITANVTVQKSILSVTTDVILQTLRGEIGQWDFLKGKRR
jgi:hypothetical protein